MTTEELNAIRNRLACPNPMALDCHRLLVEIERLQKQLEPTHLTGNWLSDLANQCAYQIHRVIGNNIEHYRGQTANELKSLIEAAIGRNSK